MGFGFWVLGFGFWVLGFGFWVLGFGFWVLGFGFWVLGFGFWVLGFGLRIRARVYYKFLYLLNTLPTLHKVLYTLTCFSPLMYV